MDHPASLSSAQPWRLAALVAAAIAALELVLILAGVALLAGPLARTVADPSEKPSAPSAPRAEKSVPKHPPARLPRNKTSVIVLNGNGVAGAAGEAATVVRALTYVVAGTDNAPRSDFARTIVMYRPGFEGEAARLARDVRVERVVPLDGLRPRDLEGAHVALILGRR